MKKLLWVSVGILAVAGLIFVSYKQEKAQPTPTPKVPSPYQTIAPIPNVPDCKDMINYNVCHKINDPKG